MRTTDRSSRGQAWVAVGTTFAVSSLLAVTAALVGCQHGESELPEQGAFAQGDAGTRPAPSVDNPTSSDEPAEASEERLPRLLDLGAGKCIPCKMMAPILDELREEYAGKLEVEFVDVWQNPDAAGKYGIEQIPTQIFFDASGKELYRHEGFFSKEDILKKWEEFDVDLGK